MNEIELALNIFSLRFNVEEVLRKMGVVRTQKITHDYGEWLATKLLNGILAPINEQDWDIEANNQRYQVKTHRKALTNQNSYSEIRTIAYPVIIFQLNPNYTIKNMHQISSQQISILNEQDDLPVIGNKYKLYWNRCPIINDQFQNLYPYLFQ